MTLPETWARIKKYFWISTTCPPPAAAATGQRGSGGRDRGWGLGEGALKSHRFSSLRGVQLAQQRRRDRRAAVRQADMQASRRDGGGWVGVIAPSPCSVGACHLQRLPPH